MTRALALLALVSVAAAGRVAAAPAEQWLVPAFEQTSTGLQEQWIGEGIAVLVGDSLASAGMTVRPARDRRVIWERHSIGPSAVVTRATLIILGRASGATHVVTGTYGVTAGVLRISARVLETAGPTLSASVEESGPLPDMLVIIGRLSGRLTRRNAALRGPLSTHPPAAVEQFIRGQLAAAPPARLSHLEQALRLAPDMHEARLEVWEAHQAQAAPEAALAAVRRVPDGIPLAREAQLRAAVSLVALGRMEEARDQFTILSRGRRDAVVLNDLGVVQARLGQSPVSAFAEAVTLAPEDPDIRFNAGYTAWRRGEPGSAIPALREAVRLRVDDGEAHYLLGQALLAVGRRIEAAAEMALAARFSERMASLPPTDARGWERLFESLQDPGVVRVEPLLASARNREQGRLAAEYLVRGREALTERRYQEALGEFRRVVYLLPYDGAAHRLVAEACLGAGLVREAVEAATLAVFSADDVTSHLLLAETFDRAGEFGAARAERQLVLTRDPTNPAARRLLGAQ